MSPEITTLHEKAKSLASQFQSAEAMLLNVLIEIETKKADHVELNAFKQAASMDLVS